ncbi:RICIN domain-containing protein [Streptomyces vinaceus]|nr:RICIN domain-containing protein [Streptomyces vinaceus]GHE76240.1 hypothetical protein GCM10017778_72500 [Streptomyces vinaceus]
MTIRLRRPSRVIALATALLCGLAAVPLTASAASAASPVCISGTIQYDYQSAEEGTAKPTRTKPLRKARVELIGAEKSTDTPHALNAVGLTDTSGNYNLCYTPTTTTSLSSVSVKVWAYNNLWRVVDESTNKYIAWQTAAISDVTGNRNIGVVKPAASTSRPFHIFDTLFTLWSNRANPTSECWSAQESDSSACSPLMVYWGESTSPNASYDGYDNRMYVYGAAADTEHAILHEGGHFLMNRLYGGKSPLVQNCRQHFVPWVSSETCAWSEGFADAVAAYLLGDSRYVHPDGTSERFTYGASWQVGDQVQGNVGGSLLDLWRGVDNGMAKTLTALTTQRPDTFSGYFNTVRPSANPPLSTGADALSKLAPHTIDYGPALAGNGTYYTLTDGGGLAVELTNSCTSGSTVVLAARDTSRGSQRWKFDANPDATVRITNGCAQPLTLTAGTDVGNPVTAQAFGSANAYQKWTVAKANGTLKLTNPQTGFVLDINGKTISAGTAVTTVWSGNANSQSWAALP